MIVTSATGVPRGARHISMAAAPEVDVWSSPGMSWNIAPVYRPPAEAYTTAQAVEIPPPPVPAYFQPLLEEPVPAGAENADTSSPVPLLLGVGAVAALVGLYVLMR